MNDVGLGWVVLSHVMCYPLYQILSTVRHECSHAIVAWLSGVRVESIKVLPHWYGGAFYFGRITYDLETLAKHENAHMCLAPYYVNVLAALSYWVLLASGVFADAGRLDLYIFASVMLIISPAVDTLYNFLKFVLHSSGDFARAKYLVELKRRGD